MALSAPQLTQLSVHPHVAQQCVGCIVPEAVFSAAVATGFYDHYIRQVPYQSASGSYSDVLDGMLVKVYSNLGVFLGNVRALSADDTYLYIAENDEITFAEGYVFYVYKYMPIWAKYPYVDITGDDPIFYKDWNVAYTDQNASPPPVPIVGPSLRFALLKGQADIDVDWDASQSYGVHSGVTITDYDWEFEGGTPSTSTSPSPTINYDTPGQYLTKLTITDSNGKTAVAWRWLLVFDDFDDQFIIDSVKTVGDFASGGYKTTIVAKPAIDVANLPDGTIIAVGTYVVDGNGSVFWSALETFVGYLDSETVEVDVVTGVATFQAVSIDAQMSKCFNFDVFCVDTTSTPSNWLEIQSLDVRKMGNHHLRWHSNILELADVFLPSDDVRTAGIDMPQGDLFTQFRSMCQRVRLYVVGSSMKGALYVQRDVQHLHWSDRYTYGSQATLTKSYIRNKVTWPRVHTNRVSMIELAGVGYDGSTAFPYFSRSPGIVPTSLGAVEEISGLAVADQDELNTLCGMVFAEKNCYTTEAGLMMAGYWLPAADIYPQTMFVLPVGFEVRGVDLSDQWVVVRGITFEVSGGVPKVTWNVDLLVQEKYGRVFYYPAPEIPDDEPDLPPIIPPPPPPPVKEPGKVIVGMYDGGVWFTNNFSSDYPNWYPLNGGLTDADSLRIQRISRDPVYYKSMGYLLTKKGIHKNTAIDTGGSWTLKLSNVALGISGRDTYGYDDLIAHTSIMKPQICSPGTVWFVVIFSNGITGYSKLHLIKATSFAENFVVTDLIANPCTELYSDCLGVGSWIWGYNFAQEANWGQFIPSPHTPNMLHLFAAAQYPSSNARSSYLRFQPGSGWNYNSCGSTLTSPVGGHVPYANNSNDNIVYMPYWWTPSGYRINKFVEGGFLVWGSCDPIDREPPATCDPGSYTASAIRGTFGSYTYDPNRIWFVNTYFDVGLSNDGGSTWTHRSCPVRAGYCSGMPYAKNVFLVGRHHYAGAEPGDTTLIVRSLDGGISWDDKTGDLYDQVWALVGGVNVTLGVTCIAPEW